LLGIISPCKDRLAVVPNNCHPFALLSRVAKLDSNLRTGDLAISDDETLNKINTKICGSPVWTRFELSRAKSLCNRTLEL